MKKLNQKKKEIKNYLTYNGCEVKYGIVSSRNKSVGEQIPSIALRTTDRDHVYENMFVHYAFSMIHGAVFYSVNRLIKDAEVLNTLAERGKLALQIYDDVTNTCFRGDATEIHTSGRRDYKIPCPDLTLCPDYLRDNTYMTWIKVVNLKPVPTLNKSKFKKLHPNKYDNLGQLEGKRWEFVYVIEN